MRELINAIPDPAVLLNLAPEELAVKMLFLLRGREDASMFHPGNLESEVWLTRYNEQGTYPQQHSGEIRLAIREAWSWLEVQGLVIPAQGINGEHGHRVLSRRARQFKDERQFADYATARLLQRDMLHSSIADVAWQSFMRGAYSTAVFEAMRAVEIAVREAAGFPSGDHGVPMIRRAFAKTTGPLTDPHSQEAEQEALAALFAGAIGSYKNPHSHRNVPLDNPREAAEVVLLASHLLRIVDSRSAAKADRDGQ